MNESATATDLSSKINVLQAIQYLSDAWIKVTSQTIQNCFAKCGVSQAKLDSLHFNDVDDTPAILQRVENFEEFLSIDDNLPCYAESASEFDFDDEIVEHIAKKQCTEEKAEDDDDNPPPPVQHENPDVV